MAADGSIVIEVNADPSKAEKAIDGIGKSLNEGVTKKAEKAADAVEGLDDGFKKAKAGAKSATESIKDDLDGVDLSLRELASAVGVAFSLDAIAGFGAAAIETASDLQEVQNVVDTAFGDMAWKVEEFAASSIESFGMSEFAAKQTAGQFMSMSTALGLSQQEAADMALSVTGLTGDMASFYNVSQDVASTALASIWTGETESLKRYGIVMTQANLEQYAMQQGIHKTMQEMTQAEQVQLRYKYVMEQTKLAQGDFVKTQDSWANQSRILNENLTVLQGTIGEGLMSVLSPILQIINAIVGGFVQFQESTGILDEFFSVLIGGITGLAAMKGIEVLQSVSAALMSVGKAALLAKVQSGILAIAVGALVTVFLQLVQAWNGMTGYEKLVAVLGMVTAAAVTAAIAVGAFQSALTLGVGVAAIAAGIFAVVAAINSAQSRAEQMGKSMQVPSMQSMPKLKRTDIPALARGAVIPPNREFLAVLGDQKNGKNIEAPVSEIEAAVARGMQNSGGGGSQTVILEVDRQVLGRVTYQLNKEQTRRFGVDLVGG